MRPASAAPLQDSDPLHGLFLTRSAIVDRERRIRAYQLDFLTATLERPPLDAILGLKQVLAGLCGGRKIFLKTDMEALKSMAPQAWTGEMVFQIPAGQVASGKGLHLPAGGERFRNLCFADFAMTEHVKPLLRLPCYVRVETQGRGEKELKRALSALKDFPVVSIASCVRTRLEFEACRNAGFELFHGDFVSEPFLSGKKTISPSQGLLLELSRHTSRNADIHVVEEIFKKNPDLAFGLFNLVHSAFFRTTANVTSIRQAIALLGYENLHKWVALMLFTIDHSDPSSSVLFEKALTRARTMEQAAKRLSGEGLPDQAYMTGIFSLVHLLFDVPLKEIMTKVNFSAEIQEALVTRAGVLGLLLDATEKLERGEYAACGQQAERLGLALPDLLGAHTSAVMEQQAPPGEGLTGAAQHDQQRDALREALPASWAQNLSDPPVRVSWLKRLLAFLGRRR